MAKGLPWVGTGPKNASGKDQYTPPGGHPGPDAQLVTGAATLPDQFVHPSLKGEVHPDKPGTARSSG